MAGTSAPHRLRLLRWQARAADLPRALALRSQLRAQGDSLQQHLEQALDDAAAALRLPPDVVVKIPCLALSLPAPPLLPRRRPSADELAAWSQWVQQLRQALVLHLRHTMAAAPAGAAQATAAPLLQTVMAQVRQDLLRYLRNGWPGWALAGSEDTARGLQTAAGQLADTWVHDDNQGLTPVMLHGFWAWTGISPDADVPRALGVLVRWLALLPAPRRARWVHARPARDLPLHLGPGAGQATRMTLLARWQAQAQDSLWAQALWLAWPQDAARQAAWQTALQQTDLPDAQAPAALGRLRVALAAAASRAATALVPLDPPVPGEPMPQPPSSEAQTEPRDDRQTAAEADTPTAHLVVPLAGMVLLHPYLARLLQGLQLHSGQAGEALTPAVLPRALALLHALACDTGAAAALELELPFLKLLLGLPPTQALDWPAARLDEADKAEVQALLEAVRQHWPALRSTSLPTLRISFLQRRGLLRRAADGQGWQLQVQGEAFDLLLASLPWSLAWVKLPWMPQPLAVDWSAPT